MTADALIAAFDTIADAPDGVRRLRELVLQIAVRGKLVPQNAVDEPAAILLERIAAQYPLPSRGRRVNPPAQTTVTPAAESEVPPGWASAPLGSVAKVIRGITFPASAKNRKPADGLIACLRTTNVQAQLEWDDVLYVSKGHVSRAEQYLRADDIVMSMANSRELVGKVALNERAVDDVTFGGFLAVVRPILVLPRYLMTVLRTPTARESLIDSSTQTTNIANISLGRLNPFLVSIPPLAEQHRIVARVDELMGLLDRLEAARTVRDNARRTARGAALAALREAFDFEACEAAWGFIAGEMDTLFTDPEDVWPLRQAVLGLAVRGRLLPAPQERLTGLGPFPVPLGWSWSTLLELTETITSGSRNWNQFYAPSGASFIRSQDIKFDKLQYDDRAYVKVPAGSEGTRTRVKRGDWLITITGANVGKCALLAEHHGDAYVSQHVALLRPKNPDFGRFGQIWLTADFGGRGILLADSYGAKPGLNLQQLRSLPVPVPPREESDKIVAKVDELMMLCDALESRLVTARELRSQFAAAAVHHFDV